MQCACATEASWQCRDAAYANSRGDARSLQMPQNQALTSCQQCHAQQPGSVCRCQVHAAAQAARCAPRYGRWGRVARSMPERFATTPTARRVRVRVRPRVRVRRLLMQRYAPRRIVRCLPRHKESLPNAVVPVAPRQRLRENVTCAQRCRACGRGTSMARRAVCARRREDVAMSRRAERLPR